MNTHKQSGQTILVFLMILLVGFTIGLGIYLNSLTELSVSVKEKESETAFNKAQSGADIAIGSSAGLSNSDLASYGLDSANVAVSSVESVSDDGNVTFTNIAQGEVVTVNLENKDGDLQNYSNIFIGWKSLDANVDCHGILVEILWLNGSNYVIDRSSYSGNNKTCIKKGSPTLSNEELNGDFQGYFKSSNIFISQGSKLRIKPFGSGADILVSGISAPQGTIYTVTGTSDAGEARAIEVNKGISSLPSIFDYVLFSKADLVKNN